LSAGRRARARRGRLERNLAPILLRRHHGPALQRPRYSDALDEYKKAKSYGSTKANDRIAKDEAKIGG
jgi:hypothetical protein